LLVLNVQLKGRGGGGRSSGGRSISRSSSFRSSYFVGYGLSGYYYYRNGPAGGYWWIPFTVIVFIILLMFFLAYCLVKHLSIRCQTAFCIILCCKCRSYREYENSLYEKERKGLEIPNTTGPY